MLATLYSVYSLGTVFSLLFVSFTAICVMLFTGGSVIPEIFKFHFITFIALVWGFLIMLRCKELGYRSRFNSLLLVVVNSMILSVMLSFIFYEHQMTTMMSQIFKALIYNYNVNVFLNIIIGTLFVPQREGT